jgi:hypothetical protein
VHEPAGRNKHGVICEWLDRSLPVTMLVVLERREMRPI